MKTCVRCFREFEESEVDVGDVSPATELVDYLDSRFHGNDRGEHGNDRGEHGNDRGKRGNDRGERGNDRGETDIGIEDINDLCPECREEFSIMNLLGFGQ